MCLQAAMLLCYIACITFHSFPLARNWKMWILLRMKLFPFVPSLAALPLTFEQGQPSIAEEIFSTLPNYVIHVLHTHTHTYEIGWRGWWEPYFCDADTKAELLFPILCVIRDFSLLLLCSDTQKITFFQEKFNTFWCFLLSESQQSSEHSPFKEQLNFGQRNPFPTWDVFLSAWKTFWHLF